MKSLPICIYIFHGISPREQKFVKGYEMYTEIVSVAQST